MCKSTDLNHPLIQQKSLLGLYSDRDLVVSQSCVVVVAASLNQRVKKLISQKYLREAFGDISQTISLFLYKVCGGKITVTNVFFSVQVNS